MSRRTDVVAVAAVAGVATLLRRRGHDQLARGEASDAGARLRRWSAIGLLVIAAGLATVALLGPLATTVVVYRVTETVRNQLIGLDLVSLLVVAPICVFAAVLTLRGHVAGPALALGIGAYTSYMFVQ